LNSGSSQTGGSAACEHKTEKEQTIFTWSVRQLPGSPLMALQRQVAGILANAIAWGTFFMIFKPALLERPTFFFLYICVTITAIAFYLKISRQKTEYRYEIYEDRATLDHNVYYSEREIKTIKLLAAICIMVFLGVALINGSILFLVGPAAIVFLAALRLLNWKNPISHEKSLPFNEYNFVTIDRKRSVIVTHVQDLTLGFETRLPDDQLFDQYLDLLRRTLPPTAEFTEKKWDLDTI
jgi:hypothetical protein